MPSKPSIPKSVSLDDLKRIAKNTMIEALGIEITAVTEDSVTGTMPVDHRTKQVYGLLHGGASVALAETLGSVGAGLSVDPKEFSCVGLEINANHIRAVSKGIVTGVAKAVHMGRTTQVWEIKIHSDDNKLVCISRITVGVVPNARVDDIKKR